MNYLKNKPENLSVFLKLGCLKTYSRILAEFFDEIYFAKFEFKFLPLFWFSNQFILTPRLVQLSTNFFWFFNRFILTPRLVQLLTKLYKIEPHTQPNTAQKGGNLLFFTNSLFDNKFHQTFCANSWRDYTLREYFELKMKRLIRLSAIEPVL